MFYPSSPALENKIGTGFEQHALKKKIVHLTSTTMKFTFISSFILSFFFFSCTEYVEGPQGVPGKDGKDGLDGEEAYVFEYTVNFNAPEYSVLINFPTGFNMLPSDVVQVYLLWNVTDGDDIWRALPQNVLTNNGLFQYNYDFTIDNVSVFLEAEFPISSMDNSYLLDQILRIVVIPGQFFDNARLDVDLSDYNEVAARFNLQKWPVDKK